MSDDATTDTELERVVLATKISQPSWIDAAGLTEECFSDPRLRTAFRGVSALELAGEPVDTIRLRGWLLDHDLLRAVGGEEGLLALTDTLPIPGLPVERLREKARLRGVMAAAQRAAAHCREGDLGEAVAALAEAHSAALSGAGKGRTQDVYELCQGVLEDLKTGGAPSVHPGYELIEKHVGRIPAGNVISIIAGTNVGKSTFTLEMLLRAAQLRDTCAGYLSVEDQEPVVRARLLSMVSGVSSRKIIMQRLDHDDFTVMTRGFARLEPLRSRLHVTCLPGGTDADVCAAMSELASRGAKIIAVDYLQKIEATRNYGSRAHEVARVASVITSHAKRLGVVLVLVTQRSRPEKGAMNTCPGKHDAKESGDIENVSEYILGLWREEEDDFAPIWCRILKGKWGGNGRTWRLERTEHGRLEEVAGSDSETPPDRRAPDESGSFRRGAR
jgi:replicative DNA helicase